MAAIRMYFANVTPDAGTYFGRRDTGAAAPQHAVQRRGQLAGLSTTASMVATLDAVVGGTAVALFVAWIQGGIVRGYALPVLSG